MAASSGAGPQASVGRIVVGVDGSPGSLAALGWALREASSRGLAVHAVAAWECPIESSFGDMATVGDFPPVVAAEEVLVSALADTGVAGDDPTVTTASLEGHPAEVLMRMASGAELLVVGSRGHGRIFGALLGSVSHYVAAHAACPVVVIKPARDKLRP
jgi:nucleotide-binding universal stress UspA family protein